MDDLIARIRAAIDEHERLAKAAAWSVADHTYAPVDVDDEKTELTSHWVARGVLGIHKRVTVDDPGWDPKVTDTVWREVGDHVQRHDPARVLRQVAAHRKILDLHRPGSPADMVDAENITVCLCCGPSGNDPTLYMFDASAGFYPCDTVLALAEAYGIEA